ncbi:MAG TPA: ArsR family transcriptional regulator [Bacteroidales bacterium]|nr:ArsR family transcriptional regulator [Bacteroidales bacterium]
MLDSLITSKTRIKLLMKFFINSNTTAYLRNLAGEFGESTNGIRQELNRFEDAQLLNSEVQQNKKIYKANTEHPYFNDIHHLLLKFTGINQVVDNVVKRVGELQKAFIINDFAQGKPGKVIDLVLVGDQFDQEYLNLLVHKAEESISFKIRYITVSPEELLDYLPEKTKSLLVWTSEDLTALSS